MPKKTRSSGQGSRSVHSKPPDLTQAPGFASITTSRTPPSEVPKPGTSPGAGSPKSNQTPPPDLSTTAPDSGAGPPKLQLQAKGAHRHACTPALGPVTHPPSCWPPSSRIAGPPPGSAALLVNRSSALRLRLFQCLHHPARPPPPPPSHLANLVPLLGKTISRLSLSRSPSSRHVLGPVFLYSRFFSPGSRTFATKTPPLQFPAPRRIERVCGSPRRVGASSRRFVLEESRIDSAFLLLLVSSIYTIHITIKPPPGPYPPRDTIESLGSIL